jgi:hypothetical protein
VALFYRGDVTLFFKYITSFPLFFDAKKNELKNADKMSAGEMHHFFSEYFKL